MATITAHVGLKLLSGDVEHVFPSEDKSQESNIVVKKKVLGNNYQEKHCCCVCFCREMMIFLRTARGHKKQARVEFTKISLSNVNKLLCLWNYAIETTAPRNLIQSHSFVEF